MTTNWKKVIKNVEEVSKEPFEFETKMTTNYEKIKNMTIEEIAEILNSIRCNKCSEVYCYESGVTCLKGIKQWLQQEVTDEL